MHLRHLTLAAALTFASPALALADGAQFIQFQWGRSATIPAYNEGYSRGLSAGGEDARRGDRFNYSDESEYRRATSGYRSDYGDRSRYTDEFRRGFEAGYRAGYRRDGVYDNRPGYPNYGGSYGRDGRAVGRFDFAADHGFNDGYEAGMNDGRNRRAFDPLGESRYRSGDRGYERSYGSRESYKVMYRSAFRDGYEQGYQDARRYGYR